MANKLTEQERQDICERPCLDSLLMLVENRKAKMLRNSPRIYDDGQKDWFTKAGSLAYAHLTEILFAASKLADEKDVVKIVDELDSIASSDE